LSVPALRALLAILLLGAGPAATAAVPDAAAPDPAVEAILGNWLTEPRDGIIHITRGPEGRYEGRIIGGNSPQRLDSSNPDPARRQQLVLGQIVLKAMRYSGGGLWSGGTIYDPDSGRTYRCRIELHGEAQLRVRGYFGVALLGRTQLWTRYLGTSLTLPAAPH
jgi:uncharacterized protein (DUF2147 family)